MSIFIGGGAAPEEFWHYRVSPPQLPICFGSRLSSTLPSLEEKPGPPEFPHSRSVRHAMVTDPGESNASLPLPPMPVLTSASHTASSLPISNFRGLGPFNFMAYGLSSRCLALNRGGLPLSSKNSLPGGWPTFRGSIHTR